MGWHCPAHSLLYLCPSVKSVVQTPHCHGQLPPPDFKPQMTQIYTDKNIAGWAGIAPPIPFFICVHL